MAIRSRNNRARIVSMIEERHPKRLPQLRRRMRHPGRALHLQQTTVPQRLGIAAATAAVGAAVVYWLDPQRGARRRAEIRQQAEHAKKAVAATVDEIPEDLANRSRGIVATARGGLTHLRERLRGDTSDDRVVTARVRSKLGRLSSHPGAIDVRSEDGCVRLSGPILTSEVDGVLRGAWRTRGVHRVDDALEPHDSSENVPALQSEATGAEERSEQSQDSWSPSFRLFSGATGIGLLALGSSRVRNPVGAGIALAGATLLLRGVTNMPLRRLTGIGAGRHSVDLRRTIQIAAPVEEVFAFFKGFENFPRFMTHVLDVKPMGDQRWRWSVTGPAGMPVSWESTVTESVPNRVLGWESAPGSVVENAGSVRFEPTSDGTRVRVWLSYNPPAGAIGHAFAAMLGAHPKKQLDDDLMRLKSLIEIGRVRMGSETITKDQIAAGADRSFH